MSRSLTFSTVRSVSAWEHKSQSARKADQRRAERHSMRGRSRASMGIVQMMNDLGHGSILALGKHCCGY